MSFNAASFEYIGGSAGNAVWRYQTSDNLCSNTVGTAAAGYFDFATRTTIPNEAGAQRQAPYPNLQKGDIILATVNAASIAVFNVTIANENGVSVVLSN